LAGTDDIVEGALATVRELLGMDVAYLAEFRDGLQLLREIEGDAASFGFERDSGPPLDGTYCVRMTRGDLPNVIPDATADSRVTGLAITRDAGIGAYVGVPVVLSDGSLYGSFCCLSTQPDPALAERDIKFMHVMARLVADRIERRRLSAERTEQLERAVIERTGELREAAAGLELAQAETVRRLSLAVEYRDEDTGTHIERIGRGTEILARASGVDARLCELLRYASPLHDAGKIAIPDAVLLKPGRLETEERAVIETHTTVGYELLRGSESQVLDLAASIAWTHHERWDGSGYPRGLRGGAIPIEGRIVALVDVFDALTSDRVYRRAFRRDEALAIMHGEREKFDPHLFDLFLDLAGSSAIS
jgi:HD-GYP domain-containing protein (c-di-GMP phosphodiesterase class II)